MLNYGGIMVILVTFAALAQCDVHSYGHKLFATRLIEQKVLFSSDSTIPQNYTVIYKSVGKSLPMFTYLEDTFSSIYPYGYVEINIENNYSNGTLTVNAERHTLEANINIINGTMVTVKLSVYESTPSMGSLTTKSFTMIQIQNATQTKFKRNSIGRRQPNDKLIYFKSQNVTKLSRFADKEFEFYGNGMQKLTCVGFSFSSPTAVAFLNSTFIKSNEIAAIVYDLSAPHFVANMSVFGYENPESIPAKYIQIVDAK